MTRNILLPSALVMLYLLLVSSTPCMAQDGSLDLSFGSGGIVTTQVYFDEDYGYAMAIQSDGKILVAGKSYTDTGNDFALVRYNTDGSLDNSFDTDGKVTTSIGNSDDVAYAVAIQSDGKIIMAGYSDVGFFDHVIALVRYNIDGSLDNSFDTDGIVTTSIEDSYEVAYAMVIQSDGQILVAGYCSSGPSRAFVLLRYNTNGSLDTSLDTDGIAITDIGPYTDEAHAIALQSDGKIILAGSFLNQQDNDFALIRYNENGSLDNTFDSDGIVTTDAGSTAETAFSIAIQNDGKIIAAGYRFAGFENDFALMRYETDGSLDNTFGTEGVVTTTNGSNFYQAQAVALQADGKILVAGSIYDYTDFALVRYNTNGSLDLTFSSDGIVSTPIAADDDDNGYAVAIQSDGKILVAGYSYDGEYNTFVLVRYNNGIENDINVIDRKTAELKIYPNPSSTLTTIRTDVALNNATFNMYNNQGQLVKQINRIVGNTIAIERENLPCGLYHMCLTQDEKIISNCSLEIID